MSNEDRMTESTSDRPVRSDAGPEPSHEEILAAKMPVQERNQPDPVLQLSVGRLGASAITLVAIIAAVIVAVVFYGLNSPAPNAQDVGTPKSVAAGPVAGAKSPAPAPGAPHGDNGHT